MGPTSPVFIVVLAVAIVALAAVTGVFWNRGRLLRRTRNAVSVLLGQVLVASLLLTAVNVHEQFYTTWPEVFGTTSTAVAVVDNGRPFTVQPPRQVGTALGTGPAGALDAWVTAKRKANNGQGSIVFETRVRGHRTRYDFPAAVYLPQAYFAPGYAHRTFPVVEIFSGGGGAPTSLFHAMPLQNAFDRGIAAGTLPPFIAVAPTRNPVRVPDTQCLDDPRGFKVFTYLADDVPAALRQMFRVRTDRGGWATMGNSSGGFCAANVALRRPSQFSTVVSLSGYFSGAINRFPLSAPGGPAAARVNRPLDAVRRSQQPFNFVMVSARDDHSSMVEIKQLVAVLRTKPADHYVEITTATGGHTSIPWRATLDTFLASLGRGLWQTPAPGAPCTAQALPGAGGTPSTPRLGRVQPTGR